MAERTNCETPESLWPSGVVPNWRSPVDPHSVLSHQSLFSVRYDDWLVEDYPGKHIFNNAESVLQISNNLYTVHPPAVSLPGNTSKRATVLKGAEMKSKLKNLTSKWGGWHTEGGGLSCTKTLVEPQINSCPFFDGQRMKKKRTVMSQKQSQGVTK